MSGKNKNLSFIQNFLASRPFFFCFIRPKEAEFISKYKRFLKPPILDFGCGDGFFAEQIFAKKEIAVGVDIEQSRILHARNVDCYQDLEVYDGKKLPFKAKFFNSIFSNSVLEHIPQPASKIKEICRVLKPGGYFITTVMTNCWDDYLLGGKVFGQIYHQWLRKKQDHYNLLSYQDWQRLFEKQGFRVVKKQGYLNKNATRLMEIGHYLSFFSLMSYYFWKKWVVWPQWYRLYKLDQLMLKFNQKNKCSLDQAASVFFVLKKIE